LRVTGVDYSRRSIEYATQYAQQHGLDIRYRYQDYLTLEDENQYDAALLIYGDFCPLSPEQRKRLLTNVRRALKPGGHFVLDVTTRVHRQKHGNRNGWYAVETGFWKPGPHLVLEEGYDYPEESIFLDQAIVIEESSKVSVYRNWFQDYDREAITAELEQAGFAVQSIWNDLIGTPYSEDAEWIGLIAQG
jgi:SAM-dependent methyltransferase